MRALYDTMQTSDEIIGQPHEIIASTVQWPIYWSTSAQQGYPQKHNNKTQVAYVFFILLGFYIL